MKKVIYSILTVLFGIFLGSITYHLNLIDGSIFDIPYFLVAFISLSLFSLILTYLFVYLLPNKPLLIVVLFYAGIFVAIISRIIYDSIYAISSHNLLGLEIIIFSILSLPFAFAGAYMGHFAKNSKRN